MAGDAAVAPVLLGLGLTELSMNAVAIPQVKQVIRHARVTELRELGRQALTLGSAPEIKQLVEDYVARLGAV
jgi:phosphotransferase system enzyme I (PtsI)